MQKSTFGRELVKRPACPFCGMNIERPKELRIRRPGEMPVGSCSCGAVYAYDATGHNLGAAFIEALVFGCNMDWDLAWGLLPEEDYLEEVVEKYDHETHLIVPGGSFEGRRISGILYFIRMHRDIREVTDRGIQNTLDRAASAPSKPPDGQAAAKTFTKKEVEELVKNYQIEPLMGAAGQDKRIAHGLQRLLFSGDELIRFRAAEILGKVSAVIAQKEPGAISKILQKLLSTFSDTGSSNWGAMDAIGEILCRSADIFAGYIPALHQFLENGEHRPKALKAIGKVAKTRPDLIRKTAFHFIPFLHDPEPETRGYAALLLGNLGAAEARSDLERIRNDDQEMSIYKDGKIEKKTVGQLASEALAKI